MQQENFRAWAFDAIPRSSVAVVHLFYHPSDSVWRDRLIARLMDLVDIEPRVLIEGTRAVPMLRKAEEPAGLAILLLSQTSVAAGFPCFSSALQCDEVLPVMIEAIDAHGSRLTDLPTPRSLDGRPLAAGSHEEVDAFLGTLRRELADRLPVGLADHESLSGTSRSDRWFAELFREHYPSLVVFFGRRGQDPELACDLAQETMIRVHRGLPDFEWHKPLRTWILTIALNVQRNWLRDRYGTRKRAHSERALDESGEMANIADSAGLWPGRAADPERLLADAEERRLLRSCFEDLSPLQQRCMTLWLEGWKYREIAEDVDVSLQTVRTTLHKAKARLRRLLGPSAPADSVRLATEEDG